MLFHPRAALWVRKTIKAVEETKHSYLNTKQHSTSFQSYQYEKGIHISYIYHITLNQLPWFPMCLP